MDRYQVFDRVEFGFVLLPAIETTNAIHNLACQVAKILSEFKVNYIKHTKIKPFNVAVRLPHLSVGHYGILATELPLLLEVTNKVAKNFNCFQEPVKSSLSIKSNNVLLELQNLNKFTNPKIKELYITLRSEYMSKFHTKFPVAQALMQKSYHYHDPKEIRLINDFYQNWDIPEEDRIQPHFTLVYNFSFCPNKVEEAISHINVANVLNSIHFTALGVVEIDYFGNPKNHGLLRAISLGEV